MFFKKCSEGKLRITIFRPSEEGIVEGMWMMYKEGTYYMFYSSSWFFLPSYHMGVARAESIYGPYTKREVPVVQTDWDRLYFLTLNGY